MHTNISLSPSFQPPSWSICVDLSTFIIADLRRALYLHHRRSTPICQPPSSPICDSLPFTIIDLQSLPFTISNLRVKVGSFQLFSLYFFVSVSCKSSFYLCSLDLWVTGVWICRSVLQCRFVFQDL